jgi:hypothetical protein
MYEENGYLLFDMGGAGRIGSATNRAALNFVLQRRKRLPDDLLGHRGASFTPLSSKPFCDSRMSRPHSKVFQT